MNNLGFIHRFIVGGGKRTLLLLHGTGGDENDLVDIGRGLNPNASLLSPRGQVDEYGSNRFFRRLREGVFDEKDIQVRARELAEFVSAAATTYGLDAEAVTAMGFSNGANMAASLLLLHPTLLASAILIRAMSPLRSPPAADLSGKRVLMLSGDSDPIVPRETADKLATELRERSAEVEHRHLAAGHGLTSQDLQIARKWLPEEPKPFSH